MNIYNWPTSMPYDTITVHDETTYTESTQNTTIDTVTIPSGPIAFIPFISPNGYGNDNELVYLNSGSIGRYGNPDYYRYGLSLYLANQFISGGGNVLGLRLKDEKAMLAHVGIVANIRIITEPTLYENIGDGTSETVYYPYFQRVGDNVTEEPRYFEGIIYHYPYLDEDGTEQPASVTIDENATIEVNGEQKKLIELYSVDEATLGLKDITSNELIYSLVNKKIVYSHITTAYFTTPEEAGSKELLETAFLKYKDPSSEAIPDGFMAGDIELQENTQYTIPLFLFHMLPSGPSNYSISLEYDNTTENYSKNLGDPERFYRMSTYDNSSEVERKISFTLGEYIYMNSSMNIEDVSLDYLVNIGYVPGNLDLIYAILDKYVTNSSIFMNDGTSHYGIDLLFGYDKYGNPHNNYKVTSDSIQSGTIINFRNGSLGDFANSDEMTKNNAIRNAFVKAYEGEITDLIFDEIRYPFEILFQPCEDTPVCDAIQDLVDARETTVASMYITPSAKTYSEARDAKLSTYAKYTTSKMFFHTESAIIRDRYTHKRIRMPAVYFNAIAIPRLLTRQGYGSPLAGKNFYWDGFIPNSMLPRSTDKNQYIENHNVWINTMIENGAGRAYAVEQITSQNTTSALSEINNSITLRRICYEALKLADNMRWNDLSIDNSITTYQSTLMQNISMIYSNAYRTLRITAERESVNGVGQNRIHCRIYVSFKSMLKGVTYDIYII